MERNNCILPLSCIICNTSYYDRKPVTDRIWRLKRAFYYFYHFDLRNADGNVSGDRISGKNNLENNSWKFVEEESDYDLVTFDHPFCERCYDILMQIQKLQDEIDNCMAAKLKNAARLQEKVVHNEAVLNVVNDWNPDDTANSSSQYKSLWVGMRRKLREVYIRFKKKNEDFITTHCHGGKDNIDDQSQTDSEGEEHSSIFGDSGSPGVLEEEEVDRHCNNEEKCNDLQHDMIKPCFVSVKRLTTSEINKHTRSTNSVETRCARRSKENAYKFLKRTLNSEENDEEGKSLKNKKARKAKKNEFESDCDEYEPAVELHSEDSHLEEDAASDLEDDKHKVKTKKASPSNLSGTKYNTVVSDSDNQRKKRRNWHNNLIYKLNESTLLYKCSLIKFSPAPFECLEDGCNEIIKETDCFSFEKLRCHVERHHSIQYPNDKAFKACPISSECKEVIRGSLELRQHLLHLHNGDGLSLICEYCWKPLQSQSYGSLKALYWNHSLTHKSQEVLEELVAKTTKTHQNPPASLIEELNIRKRMEEKTEFRRMILGRVQTQAYSNTTTILKERRKLRRNRHNRMYYKITDDLLLYKLCLVQVTSEKLVCQEPECFETIDGCNYSSYAKMRKHVEEIHSSDSVDGLVKTCPVCKSEFNSGPDFRFHLREFHDIKRFCELCLQTFPSESYAKHIQLHKNIGDIPEDFETEIFRRPQTDKIYKAKYKKLRKGKGKFCENTVNKDDEQKPIRSIEKDKILNYIPKEKVKKKRYSRKMPPYSMLRPDCPPVIEYTYLLNEDYMLHGNSLVKYSPLEFACQEIDCGYRHEINGNDFLAFENFKNHVVESHFSSGLVPNASGGTTCPICSEFIQGSPKMFRSHIIRLHSPPVVCKSCWKPLKLHYIRQHSYTHMNEEERANKLSESGSNRPSVKKTVILKSTNPELKPFACLQCPKVFRNIYNLRAHEITHLPRHLRKIYDCTYCDLKLLSPMALQSHIERAHRPEIARKRICPVCNKEFHYRDGDHFRRHVRTHSGVAPWICHICGKGFYAKNRMTEHVERVHSSIALFQCEFCASSYKHPKNLRNHQKKAHKDKIAVPCQEEKLLRSNK